MKEGHILNKLKEEKIKFVSFFFTDLLGKFHRITYSTEHLDITTFETGIAFDGSSIIAWKEIHHSDTLLSPDVNSMFMDPFTLESCACFICDVVDPETSASYSRDPRSIATNAERYLKASGIADTAFFGPEVEFFVFDDVQFDVSHYGSFYRLDGEENPANNALKFNDRNNLGHRPGIKGGYFPAQPIDALFDLRNEMCNALDSVGIHSILHHHEVASSQCEIGFKFSTLRSSADNAQKFKYVVRNVAASFGKSVTFMPKPIYKENGSGMHTHQSLWKNGEPIFFDSNGYAELSENALYYIGGVLKHAKAISAFSNPTTNSYKRLVPGFEAPAKLAYSANNRSAAIRIPATKSPSAKRIEARFPDPSANGYLAFAAMMMAGLDGIKNKIDPGKPADKDLYHLAVKEASKIPDISSSLCDAIAALKKDHGFLLEGGVFSEDIINAYIGIKEDDIRDFAAAPHPMEFVKYYSL